MKKERESMELNELYDIVSRGLSVKETLRLLQDAFANNPPLKEALFYTPDKAFLVWMEAHREEIWEIQEEERASVPVEPAPPLFKAQIEWPEETEYLSRGSFFDIPSSPAPRVGLFGRLVMFARRARNELRRFGY